MIIQRIRVLGCLSVIMALLAPSCAVSTPKPPPTLLVYSRGNEESLLVGDGSGVGPLRDISALIAEPGKSRISFGGSAGNTILFRVCSATGNTPDFRYGSCQLEVDPIFRTRKSRFSG